MPETPPVVYLLIGDDEFAIAEFIANVVEKMGDQTMAEVNTTRLDGRANSLDELEAAARSMPFLVPRRLVIFNHPLEKARTPDQQGHLKEILAHIPPTTAVVLVEDRFLTSEQDRRKKKIHWLESWAQEQTKKVYLRFFPLPVGPDLVRWIQRRAKEMKGEITPQAAELLAVLVGSEPRFLDHEIAKLLSYVNFTRPIEVDDVQSLTPSVAKVGDFALMNALRQGDSRQALSLLHREMAEKDVLMIFAAITYQVRQLLLAREVIDQGGGEEDVARLLKIHPYAASLAAAHARQFTQVELEEIYHRLLDLDEAMKTGGMEGELALDMLVTELTT